jgi:hypothetical protein
MKVRYDNRKIWFVIGAITFLVCFSSSEWALGAGGDLLWEAQFNQVGGHDWAYAIGIGGNTVFVTGVVRNALANDDILTLAYDARTGNLFWEAQFDKAWGNDWGHAIAVGSNTVFVTGYGRNASGNDDIVTLAYNAKTGNLLWEAQFDKAGGTDWGKAIAVKGNTVFVTGFGTNSSGNEDIVTLAYDAKTGNLLWEAQFDKAGGDDWAEAMTIGGNTVFVAGIGRNSSGNRDIVVLAYGAKTGNLLWEAQFDKAGGDDYGEAIAVKGSILFVFGRGLISSGNHDILTLAYDTTTGSLLWEAQFDKAGSHDFASAIAVGSNAVFVTGVGTNSSGNYDIVTVAYDASTGNQLWEAQFDKAGGNDWANAIAVKGNTVFVTGYGRNTSGNNDIVTLAYNARTGNLLWEAQFDKAGQNDWGSALAIKGNTLFVTGYGTNSGGNEDVVVLAYKLN